MKKLLLAFLLLASPAHAICTSGTLPFQLQNGTVADATQVMADFNQILNGMLTTCAASGANSDITSLGALSTPISAAQGGTSIFLAGTSGGAPNAQTITTSTPASGWALTLGYKVSFTAGAANTGAMTLVVNGTGALAVTRHTQLGAAPLVGGELVAGARQLAEYDGVGYQLVGPPVIVGQVFDSAGACPAGTFSANSQAVSRATYATLFTVIGTTWGPGDGSTTFNVPDLRNRATYGQDQNVGGLSSRITVAGGNFDGTVIGNAGGLQNHTMTLGELVTHNHIDAGHTHPQQATTVINAAGATTLQGNEANLSLGGTTQSGAANIQNTGSSTPFTVLAPAAIVSKCIQS